MKDKEAPYSDRITAADKLLDRAYGKAKEHITVETNDLLAVTYRSLEEIHADMRARGLLPEHTREPKMIEHERGR